MPGSLAMAGSSRFWAGATDAWSSGQLSLNSRKLTIGGRGGAGVHVDSPAG